MQFVVDLAHVTDRHGREFVVVGPVQISVNFQHLCVLSQGCRVVPQAILAGCYVAQALCPVLLLPEGAS